VVAVNVMVNGVVAFDSTVAFDGMVDGMVDAFMSLLLAAVMSLLLAAIGLFLVIV